MQPPNNKPIKLVVIRVFLDILLTSLYTYKLIDLFYSYKGRILSKSLLGSS